jgi:hypothetical protein
MRGVSRSRPVSLHANSGCGEILPDDTVITFKTALNHSDLCTRRRTSSKFDAAFRLSVGILRLHLLSHHVNCL